MRRVAAVIVGAGHAGLAMSRCLGDLGIDHVVLERGEVANSWRTERWDSLRLLTPNWQSRLPGYGYRGDDPDGFRTMPEVTAFIEGYARTFAAPVETRTTVTSVACADDGYSVVTDRGEWRARAVVLASGACNLAAVPKQAMPPSVVTLTSMQYRNPGQLDPGGVLVVGASATGIQLAREIRQSGRPVMLAVGEHVRVPRSYRGRDIQWWLDRTGILDQRWDEVDDVERVRGLPSFQLVGSAERGTLDLNALQALGIEPVGRLAGISGQTLQFSGGLANLCALADLKMSRLLDGIDQWIAERGDGAAPDDRPPPTAVPERPRLTLDLGRGGIRTVIWATGYRPDHGWLHVPVLDRKGRLVHDGGVTASPGLYAIGLPFLRRRKSTLIDGAADDAADLSRHLSCFLAGRACRRAA